MEKGRQSNIGNQELSLIGIITAHGGLFAIIGGALAIGWKPSGQPEPPPPR